MGPMTGINGRNLCRASSRFLGKDDTDIRNPDHSRVSFEFYDDNQECFFMNKHILSNDEYK